MPHSAIQNETIAHVVNNLEQEVRRLRGMLHDREASSPPTSIQEHPYVEKVFKVLGGEPVIKDTRTSVRSIVEYWKFGATPEEIAGKLPHLRLAQIFDALSYYDDHREEIEGHIALNHVSVDD